MGSNEQTAILKKPNHQLLWIAIDKLSATDQEYLKSEEAAAKMREQSQAQQTWTMKSGLKVIGNVVDYGRRDVTIQRIRGKIYVNDKPFDKLDGVYQQMVPLTVAHFEKLEIDDKKGLDAWLIKQKGAAKTFTCEGVMLQLPNEDLYGVPFFFFSDADLKVLQPGWERWSAADKKHEDQEQQRFALEQQAQAYQANQEANQQMMQLQLQLQGYQAGLFDLWEVAIHPRVGYAGMSQLVVVPARNSEQAAAAALQRYPGYVAGAAAKVQRKY